MATSVVSSVRAAVLQPSITLTAHPTLEQLKIWWAEMQLDPLRQKAYTDFMPREIEDFLAPVRSGAIQLRMFLCDEQVGGVFYFHDMGADATGSYAWLGAYILPPYRGKITAQAWSIVRQACASDGLERIFAAIRETNCPAKRFITGTLGFTRLGNYKDWAPFQGSLGTVTLFSMRRQDQALAWVLAEKRAGQFRALPTEQSCVSQNHDQASEELLNSADWATEVLDRY